jgi:hypothetical protein
MMFKVVNQALSNYSRYVPDDKATKVIEWAMQAELGYLAVKRALKGGFSHDPTSPIDWDRDGAMMVMHHDIVAKTEYASNSPVDMDRKRAMEQMIKEKEGKLYSSRMPDIFKVTPTAYKVQDFVALINIDHGGFDKGHRVIKLPFIPTELNYNSESVFAAIKPIGRNTSKYHFTGSEDKLEFEIDWHSFSETRQDVIYQCREVEALSKSDGYSNPPPRVMLQWGSDNVLFKDHLFVVLSAPYKMSLFSKANVNQSNGQIDRKNMLPIQATQKVTLARISSTSLTTQDIQHVSIND